MAAYLDQFKYSVIDSPVGATSALFSVNPTEVDWQIGKIFNLVTIMDGEPVAQKPLYDNRVRRMVWRGYPIISTSIISMIAQLETDMVNKYFWFIDGSIGHFTDWVKCRGINLLKTHRSGGKQKYDEVIFEFIVVDSSWSNF